MGHKRPGLSELGFGREIRTELKRTTKRGRLQTEAAASTTSDPCHHKKQLKDFNCIVLGDKELNITRIKGEDKN
jgi:hypothetical protein